MFFKDTQFQFEKILFKNNQNLVVILIGQNGNDFLFLDPLISEKEENCII